MNFACSAEHERQANIGPTYAGDTKNQEYGLESIEECLSLLSREPGVGSGITPCGSLRLQGRKVRVVSL
jgi:hypothetical protein